MYRYASMPTRFMGVFQLANGLVLSYTKQVYASQCRHLISEDKTGLFGFKKKRESIGHRFQPIQHSIFRQKMREMVNEKATQMPVYVDDIIRMTLICENNDSDFDLLLALLENCLSKNESSVFAHGPELMRLFDLHNRPLLALKTFRNETFKGIFNHLSTYVILMDLLYKNGYYEEVIAIMRSFKDNTLLPYDRSYLCIAVFIASCYKLNTKEIFDEAVITFKRSIDGVDRINSVAQSFLSALAINVGQPDIALEIISLNKMNLTYHQKNMKIIALSQCNRITDALQCLHDYSFGNGNSALKTICKESIDAVEEALNLNEKKNLKEEFLNDKMYLLNKKMIDARTLDNQLCSLIIGSKLHQDKVISPPNYSPRHGPQRRRGLVYEE